MAVAPEQQIARLTDAVLRLRAQMTLTDLAIQALFATHPHPDRLRIFFETSAEGVLDRALNSRYPDDILQEVENLYQAYRKQIDIADDAARRRGDP